MDSCFIGIVDVGLGAFVKLLVVVCQLIFSKIIHPVNSLIVIFMSVAVKKEKQSRKHENFIGFFVLSWFRNKNSFSFMRLSVKPKLHNEQRPSGIRFKVGQLFELVRLR